MRILQEGDLFVATGEDKDFGCCKCSHIIQINEDGFHCKTIKGKEGKQDFYRLFCEACQNKWNKTNINLEVACLIEQLENNGEHCHTRFTRKKS